MYTHFADVVQKNVNDGEEFCQQRLQRKVQSLNENWQVCYLLNILCWCEYREPFHLTADYLNENWQVCYLLNILCWGEYREPFHLTADYLTLKLLMSYIYIYGAPILDVSRSHTTTQHSR